ncbi:MAG TPA: hypothetical protein VFT06_05900, partial [Flavisolibacter sp.]|nr:hypothetical protein [Flavisolibacter sp.]
MKRHSNHTFRQLLCLLALFAFVFLYSCQKDIQKIPGANPETDQLSKADKSGKAKHESADVVLGWYRFITNVQLRIAPQPSPLAMTRNFGYIGVALYEAVRPGIKHGETLSNLLYQMPQMPAIDADKTYLWGASANAALASLFTLFLPSLTDADKASIALQEQSYRSGFVQRTSEEVVSRSEAFGRAVATTIFNWSKTDNFTLSSAGYTPPVYPGAWVPTPPAYAPPTGAFLKNSRPFLAYSLTALAPPMPVVYSEDPSSAFYQSVKEVYDIGKTLTTEQKAIANWWADAGGPGVGLPAPYHFLSIITQLLEEDKKTDLEMAAEVYAKTGIAMRDGPINTFRSKFTYNLIRPISYIQQHIDPTWMSYLTTPPYPEYPSGLVGIFGPVSQVLIREF